MKEHNLPVLSSLCFHFFSYGEIKKMCSDVKWLNTYFRNPHLHWNTLNILNGVFDSLVPFSWAVQSTFLSFPVIDASSVLLYTLGLEIKGQAVEDQFLSTHPPDLLSEVDRVSHSLPTISANSPLESTAAPQPAKIPPSETRNRFMPNRPFIL